MEVHPEGSWVRHANGAGAPFLQPHRSLCSSAPWSCTRTQGPHSRAAQSRDPLAGKMKNQERPSRSLAKGVRWHKWLQPRWNSENPDAGAGHQTCWEWREAPAPTTRKKGRMKRWHRKGGWSEAILRTQQVRDGLERGVANPRRSRQMLRVRGADSCGLRRAEKSSWDCQTQVTIQGNLSKNKVGKSRN